MNRTYAAWVLVVLFCVQIAAAGSAREPVRTATPSGKVDTQQYRDQLTALEASLDTLAERPDLASKLADSLPDAWTIDSAQGMVRVDATALQRGLREYSTTKSPAALKSVRKLLRHMESDADEFARPIHATNARDHLRGILSRREFRGVEAQSPLEAWKDRLLRWMLRLLGRGFEHLPETPIFGRVLLWSLMACTVAIAGILIWRVLSRAARDTASLGDLTPHDAPSAKPWRQWLAEAEAAAQRGDLRDAIHLGYWASISYLEAGGSWRPDRARTPREYLSLLPEQSTRREPLTELTWCFENTWYGNRPASEQDFSFAMVQLERLGCR
jgi:hypothetical protein